jgi:hypothetical protein
MKLVLASKPCPDKGQAMHALLGHEGASKDELNFLHPKKNKIKNKIK